MHIESGPNTERSIRNLLMLLMVAFFAAWFAYDGWIGYPAKNFEDLLKQMPPDLREKAAKAAVYPSITEALLPQIEAATKAISPAAAKEMLASAVGGPPSLETPDTWFYFGPAMGYKLSIERGAPVRFAAMRTPKSAMDIRLQRYLAMGLMALTAYLVVFNLMLRRTRMVLNDVGLTVAGTGPIPWSAMKSLDISRFADKGWVDLIYDDHGTQRTLRLNEYHHSAFDDVIDALCRQKGFENPLPLPEPSPADASPRADSESRQ